MEFNNNLIIVIIVLVIIYFLYINNSIESDIIGKYIDIYDNENLLSAKDIPIELNKVKSIIISKAAIPRLNMKPNQNLKVFCNYAKNDKEESYSMLEMPYKKFSEKTFNGIEFNPGNILIKQIFINKIDKSCPKLEIKKILNNK
jgi:hypothetical protein